MTNEEIKQKVLDVASTYVSEHGVAMAVTSETTFGDMFLDSLDTVELIMEVEKVFDISISDMDMEEMHTVGDIVKNVTAQLGDS